MMEEQMKRMSTDDDRHPDKKIHNAIIDVEIASDRIFQARGRVRRTGNDKAIAAIELCYKKIRKVHELLTGEKDLS